VVEQFSARSPVKMPAGSLVPTIEMTGMGDFLFLAVYFAIIQRFGLNSRRTLWLCFLVLLLAPFAFAFAPRLPGLPFISAAVVAANWREMSFTREEKRALAIAGGIVLVALGAILGLRFALGR